MKYDIAQITSIYNKKYGIPVYSGTLAIESILKILNLKNKTKVLISSTVCHSILQAILSVNLTPIIAIPNNGVTLSLKELNKIIEEENIKVFIAVHQYGYEQEIPNNSNLIIIEDISQAWDIQLYNSKVGEKSDYIITSLGKTKPLSNGIGGLILTDNNILDFFDYKQKDCRLNNHNLIEYYYEKKINYKKLKKLASKRIYYQRKNAKYLDKIFSNNKYIKNIKSKELPSYHRYVVQLEEKYMEEFISLLNKFNINFQKEYRIKLYELPIIKKYKIKVIGKNNKNYILIRPNNSIKKIKKLEKEMRDKKWIIN